MASQAGRHHSYIQYPLAIELDVTIDVFDAHRIHGVQRRIHRVRPTS
jgi:hypothetical protein